MANWQRNIRLNPEWEQSKDGQITYQQLAAAIAKKLRALRPFKAELDDINEQLDTIASEFEGMADDASTSADDIDSVMHDLYDWGDMRLDGEWNGKRVCFVDTISGATPVALHQGN
jgi:hypothetical protein